MELQTNINQHCDIQSNVDLVNDNVLSKFGLNKSIIFKILNKNRMFTYIKGCNFVAKLRKITFYNPKVDLVKENVYAKFGLS